ncbi:ABC transporter ATP-binding protein [Arenibaculum pallidiluteum]|uniref:ABC transporter ATP-binding protein n=1 Tax=Arenibaculum pallidiluteum TaxID=2812559 RepID=UPI001A95C26B|nr:ABC transporter ATP-binding protein [Arenibaculum pallidiluteum]
MTAPLLSVRQVEKTFGALRALGPVELDLRPGERLGLIGPNGSGKTTLINCIAGLLVPTAGAIVYAGEDVTRRPAHKRARMGIARSFQIPRPFTGMTVLENLFVPLDYLGRGAGDARARAEGVLRSMRLDGRRDAPVESLSQLELRKLELARALVTEPRLLIADEAMAGLADSEIDEILSLLLDLNRTGVAVIMIEHIMHAVMRFSERVICLETGRIIAEGTPQSIVEDPHVQRVYFGEQQNRP